MQIIVPMAGNGSRFLNAGYEIPKPLIEVHSKPMIEHVVNLFKKDDEFVFITNKKHDQKHKMKERLQKLKPGAKIIDIFYEKLGPVWGTMQAADHIKDTEPTIVVYCDINISLDYDNFEKTMKKSGVDGAISCFTGFQPHFYGSNKYAGVKVNDKNMVSEVREKHHFNEDKTKSWHSNGVYYFKTGRLVKKYFRKLIDQRLCHDNGEYYVSQVYNEMIKDRLRIILYPVDHFCDWGTPESLNEYNVWQSVLEDIDSKDFGNKHIKELGEQFPHIPKNDHLRILKYWHDFNERKLAKNL